MNVCSIWSFAQISDDCYYRDVWQCARYFVAALFKELALTTIREMWGLEQGPDYWGRGVQCPGAALFGGTALLVKEGIANGFSRMNLKLDFG